MFLDFVHYVFEVVQVDDAFVRLTVHHEGWHHRFVAALRQQFDRIVDEC